MQTILVPTDFSAVSCNAARYAADMAGSIRAKLVLIHVLDEALDKDDASLSEISAQMSSLKDQLLDYSKAGVSVSTQLVSGNFSEQIDALGQTYDPFAIIMGAKGEGAAATLFLGSHTMDISHNLNWPLVVVPADAIFGSIDKIGLACEMKNVSETIPLKGLRNLFSYFRAPMEALYVIRPDENVSMQVISESKLLQQKLEKLDPGISMITQSDIAEGVADFVYKHNIDLLLAIPKRRGFLESIFQRNSTDTGLLRSDIPVMVLHA